ncbi:MBL fold metallo-hydrolase [Roseibium sediminis]|uniref:MBL fold metallo-hydrolase n=1 Tax=Roseibium sediminis TaxID=1775174 RepID=UPI001FCB43E7|nr:MBL fold metallo-hydrolase [Roseibium sediminis]
MKHDREFDPNYGLATEVADGIRRLTANNPSPFTFHGTNTYLVGQKSVVVIDPGPADAQHLEAILTATKGQTVEAIVVSHTHVDHSPGAALLKERTGAPVIGCTPHRPARALVDGEINALDASGDKAFRADRELENGTVARFGEFSLEAIATPGHTENHLCFALEGSAYLFSADHVMAWSTSIVAPPDGNMRAYMVSLDKMLERSETIYFPGHGGPVGDAATYVGDLKHHRLQREAAILARLGSEPISIPELVDAIYEGLPPMLKPAAALSVFAQLEDLVDRRLAKADPVIGLNAFYTR